MSDSDYLEELVNKLGEILDCQEGEDVVEAATRVVGERDALITRRDELLQTVRRISLEAPFEDEDKELRARVAALIAEIGTLRARVTELEMEMVL